MSKFRFNTTNVFCLIVCSLMETEIQKEISHFWPESSSVYCHIYLHVQQICILCESASLFSLMRKYKKSFMSWNMFEQPESPHAPVVHKSGDFAAAGDTWGFTPNTYTHTHTTCMKESLSGKVENRWSSPADNVGGCWHSLNLLEQESCSRQNMFVSLCAQTFPLFMLHAVQFCVTCSFCSPSLFSQVNFSDLGAAGFYLISRATVSQQLLDDCWEIWFEYSRSI